jgi:hypothetical protein
MSNLAAQIKSDRRIYRLIFYLAEIAASNDIATSGTNLIQQETNNEIVSRMVQRERF